MTKLARLALALGAFALAAPATAEDLSAQIREARWHIARGDRAALDGLIARAPALAAVTDAEAPAQVTATFLSRGEGLRIRAQRPEGLKGAFALVLKPGTLALPLSVSESEPLPQDLACLQAAVLAFDAHQSSAEVVVPVACARFKRQGPEPGVAYKLRALPAKDRLTRVLARMCQGDEARPEEVALAVWVVHEGLSWSYFDARTFRSFPTPRVEVGRGAVPGAAGLLQRAGLDPRALPLFKDAEAAGLALPAAPVDGFES